MIEINVAEVNTFLRLRKQRFQKLLFKCALSILER